MVMKDLIIRQAVDAMVDETDFEYQHITDTDHFQQTLAKCMAEDQDLRNVLIGVDTMWIDTIIVPMIYDGMVAALLIRGGMTLFEYIYSIAICVLVGTSLGCYSCI